MTVDQIVKMLKHRRAAMYHGLHEAIAAGNEVGYIVRITRIELINDILLRIEEAKKVVR